jgi:hypothetical protein
LLAVATALVAACGAFSLRGSTVTAQAGGELQYMGIVTASAPASNHCSRRGLAVAPARSVRPAASR